MIREKRYYGLITIVVMALLTLYSYFCILSLGFEGSTSTSYMSLIKLSVLTLSVLVTIFSRNRCQTSFSMFWLIWCIWMFVVFFGFGLRGEGLSNIVHVTFCPMLFLLFYTMALYNERVLKISVIGFLLLDALTIYLIIVNLNEVLGVHIGEDVGISNLIFWCLCPLPILLIMEEKWKQIVVIAITALMIIITGKRSAFIAIAVIVLLYVFYYSSSRRNKIRNVLVFLILGAVIAFIISYFLKGTFFGVLERFRSLNDDQGSSRIPLYRDVLMEMKNNTILDWVFGRGYGSIVVTRHTNAHNDALQLLFEYGLIGLVVYIIMIVKILKRMFVLRKNKSDLYASYASSVVITIVVGLVSNLFVFYSYFAFICAYWGIVEAKMMKSGYLKYTILK